MTALRQSDIDEAERFVGLLRQDQVLNVLEHLSEPGAVAEFGAEYLLFVRGLLLRRLESFGRGRRGLVSVPRRERP